MRERLESRAANGRPFLSQAGGTGKAWVGSRCNALETPAQVSNQDRLAMIFRYLPFVDALMNSLRTAPCDLVSGVGFSSVSTSGASMTGTPSYRRITR